MYINNDKIEIKRLSENNIKDIKKLQDVVISNMEDKTFFIPYDDEEIIEVCRKNGCFYGALYNEELTAIICLAINSNSNKELGNKLDLKSNFADIDGVMVHPKYIGNGIQRKLVSYIETIAKEKGIEYLIAEVTIDNKYSLDNMLKLGYKIKKEYLKNNKIRRYILVKEI